MAKNAGDAKAGLTSNNSLQLARILWSEMRHRHDLFWRLFFRSTLAVLALLSAPLFYVEQLSKSLGNRSLLLIFPVLAVAVAVVATAMILNELKLLRGSIAAYRGIVEAHVENLGLLDRYRVPAASIATKSVIAFLVITIAVAGFEIWIFLATSQNK